MELAGQDYADETFQGLDLAAEVLEDKRFTDCRIVRCRLAGAVLRRCRFVGCSFADCDLGNLSVPDTGFAGCSLTDCKAIGIDWTRAAWPRVAVGEPLRFERSVLNHSTFLGLKLAGAKFLECAAREADFREADLSGADFGETDLLGALFTGTKLVKADLSASRNYRIVPAENQLTGAKFSLPEAMALLHAMDIEIVE